MTDKKDNITFKIKLLGKFVYLGYKVSSNNDQQVAVKHRINFYCVYFFYIIQKETL